MSNAEWESLCDGCARCCLEKLEDEDTGKIYFTHVSCKLLDSGLCACKDYPNRSDKVPDCVRLTPENVRTLNWLPPSCGYKLVAEGRDLYWWHPLISGDPNTVHEAGVSVRGRVQRHRGRDTRRGSGRSHRAMACAVAEAGAAEEAAEGLTDRPRCADRSRERDDALAGCTHAPTVLPRRRFALYCAAQMAIPSRRLWSRGTLLHLEMNKHERQGRQPADQTTLPDDIGSEMSRITTEVIDVGDAPPIAPPAPLTQDEVRTILMSLLLTMFLAALDQTIVATALPTIGRQFNDVSNLSWVITAYLLASTAVAPVFGTLSDIYGRRAMITVSLVLFTVGSILCARSTQHDSADCRARPAGARRRRHHAGGADRDLRRGLTARARASIRPISAASGWLRDCWGPSLAACSPSICTGR